MSETEKAVLIQQEPDAPDSETEASPAVAVAAPPAAHDSESTEPDQYSTALAEEPSQEALMAAAESTAVRAEGAEEFDNLLDAYPQFSQPSTGSLMKGRVVNITPSEVVVDVGYKCEGVIPLSEFVIGGSVRVQPGDEIEVLMDSGEERDGYVVLSYAKARRIRAWSEIESAYQHETPITGVVLEKTKGGLAVDIGMRAFLPGSQVDVRPVRNLDALVGQEISCRIIKVNRKRGNIVVSRKQILEEESKRRKEAVTALLQDGAVLQGTVKNLTEYGAFVDLGGIDGLLHITDLSWGRVSHPSEVVQVGQQIQVKVLKYDPEKERVSLGLKQFTEDPWLHVAEKYAVGTRVEGKVLNVTDYGAFIELEPGIEGLVHVSEMSWSKRLRHPSKIVSRGQQVNAMVLDVNVQDRRISLGLKQTEPNPWMQLTERYSVGSIVQGKIRNLTEFGAFIEVEPGIDGLVHVSDLSWTHRVKHPSEILKKGETVRAAILHIDPENRRLSLGIKQLQPDSWHQFCDAHKVGDLVRGKVARKTSFGVFVEVSEGLEGLCHVSEISSEPGQRRGNSLDVGQEEEFRIIKLSPEDRKIGLSRKAAMPEPVRVEPVKLPPQHSSSSGATTNIGELMAMKERQPVKN